MFLITFATSKTQKQSEYDTHRIKKQAVSGTDDSELEAP